MALLTSNLARLDHYLNAFLDFEHATVIFSKKPTVMNFEFSVKIS